MKSLYAGLILFFLACFPALAFVPTPVGANGSWEHTENGVTYTFDGVFGKFEIKSVDPLLAGKVTIRDRVYYAADFGTEWYFTNPNSVDTGDGTGVGSTGPIEYVLYTIDPFDIPPNTFENCDQITELEIGTSFAVGVTPLLLEDCTALEAITVFIHRSDTLTDAANSGDPHFASDGVLFGLRRPSSNLPLATSLVYYPAAKTATDYTVPNFTSAIGPEAVRYSQSSALVNLVVPATVSRIGQNAFLSHDNLRTIQFNGTPASLVFESGAFASVNLTALSEFAASSISFGASSFSNLTGTASLTFSSNVTSLFFGDFSFGNTPFTSLVLPDANITFRPSAFSNAAIETLTFPTGASDRNIGIDSEAFASIEANSVDFGDAQIVLKHKSFSGSDLKNVHLGPATFFETFYANRIDDLFQGSLFGSNRFSPFPNTLLESFTVDAGNPHFKATGGVLFSKDGKDLVIYPKRRAGTRYTVPEGVENVLSDAFYNPRTLQEITFPQSLLRIETRAIKFARLKEITFLGSAPLLETVQVYLDLRNEPTGSTQTIPSEFVTSINSAVNPDPKAIVVNVDDLPSFGLLGDDFGNFELSIYLELTLDTDDQYIVTGIDADFEGDLILPESFQGKTVKAIGASAFQFRLVETITIPNSIQSIGNFAFNSSALRNILSFGGVQTIGQGAFASTSLVEVRLPDGLLQIPNNCFQNSSELQLAVIPASVTTVGSNAFAGCGKLETIVAEGAAFSSVGFESFFSDADSPIILVTPTHLASFGGLGANYFSYTVGLQNLPYIGEAGALGGSFLDPTEDTINRGFKNGVAYALGVDLDATPTPEQRSRLPKITEVGGDYWVEFVIPKLLPLDLRIAVEVSPDLTSGSWSEVAYKETGFEWQDPLNRLEIEGLNPESQTVRVNLGTNRFSRLSVTF